jgi:hypothetical protein
MRIAVPAIRPTVSDHCIYPTSPNASHLFLSFYDNTYEEQLIDITAVALPAGAYVDIFFVNDPGRYF